MTEPHHRHLAEMRASLPGATAMDEFRAIMADVPCRALTGESLATARARYAALATRRYFTVTPAAKRDAIAAAFDRPASRLPVRAARKVQRGEK